MNDRGGYAKIPNVTELFVSQRIWFHNEPFDHGEPRAPPHRPAGPGRTLSDAYAVRRWPESLEGSAAKARLEVNR